MFPNIVRLNGRVELKYNNREYLAVRTVDEVSHILLNGVIKEGMVGPPGAEQLFGRSGAGDLNKHRQGA